MVTNTVLILITYILTYKYLRLYAIIILAHYTYINRIPTTLTSTFLTYVLYTNFYQLVTQLYIIFIQNVLLYL